MKATPPTNRPPFTGAATPQGGHLHKAREVDQPQDNTSNENQNERSVTNADRRLTRLNCLELLLDSSGVLPADEARWLCHQMREVMHAASASAALAAHYRNQNGPLEVQQRNASSRLTEALREADPKQGIRDTLAILRGDA